MASSLVTGPWGWPRAGWRVRGVRSVVFVPWGGCRWLRRERSPRSSRPANTGPLRCPARASRSTTLSSPPSFFMSSVSHVYGLSGTTSGRPGLSSLNCIQVHYRIPVPCTGLLLSGYPLVQAKLPARGLQRVRLLCAALHPRLHFATARGSCLPPTNSPFPILSFLVGDQQPVDVLQSIIL